MSETKPETLEAAALEYLDRGYSIIPIRPDTKRPFIKWLELQHRQPTEAEVSSWFEMWPNAQLAIVTGEISGIVVVDCDNEEALQHAVNCGMRSPVMVKTKRGWHMWFTHPNDGVRRGPRAGGNSRGEDWPKFGGLDFRGDGSYALLPPSENYSWKVTAGFDIDEAPVWKDWRPTHPSETSTEFVFENLDLSNVSFNPSSLMTEWERTERDIVKGEFPHNRIPTGQSNSRNERVMRYASECIMQGNFGPELRVKVRYFMDHFFMNHLPDIEFETTVASVEQMEKRNHPERFNEKGEYIFKRLKTHVTETGALRTRKLLTDADAEDLINAGKNQEYLIEPWLTPQTIVQVHGYSGSGKTMYVQHALYAMASGARHFGPYQINHTGRVLYLDWELSRGDEGMRLKDLRDQFGSAGDRFSVWTPWLEDRDMNLRTAEGIAELQSWVQYYRPDVVVIDTIRSGWSGLSENSAEDWAQVNRLAIKLRNAGMSVIMLHHSNKPGEDGLGREAGSTNQLTVLETQIRIAQVYREEDVAKAKAGIWNGKYPVPPFAALEAKLGAEWVLDMVIEARYGKTRSWTALHDSESFIGWATHQITGKKKMVSSMSTKQRAKEMALNGKTPVDISKALLKPLAVISEWLELA